MKAIRKTLEASRKAKVAILLFVAVVALTAMTLFMLAKVFVWPDITVWETQLTTILFVTIIVPVIGFFIILRFENLYRKMREYEEMLSKSQEMAHIGSWEWNLATGKIERTAESYRIFGMEQGTRLNYDRFLAFIVPEDRDRVDAEIQTSATNGKSYNVTYRIRRADGAARILQSWGEPVKDDSGKIVRMYGTNQDITERKEAEDALAASKAQIELYLDLMGHDINNMHQIALGYIEMARAMPVPESQDAMLAKAMDVLDRSTRLIQNVRKLQSIKEGKLVHEITDVCKAIGEVCAYEVPGKTIVINLNCKSCHVDTDGLLNDVFSNLVGNAIKHTGPGTDVVVTVNAVKENGKRYCQIMVEDNGSGITDVAKAKLFARSRHGSGLGLYLVKTLVESYGGRVWVEDRVHGDHTKGARFVVMLPEVEPNGR